jgi:hypothetical protein
MVDTSESNVNVNLIPCPFGSPGIQVIIRDNIDPLEPHFDRDQVIINRLKSGPILYAMCPLALAVKHRLSNVHVEDKKQLFITNMRKYRCDQSSSEVYGNGNTVSPCMFSSGRWTELENFVD